MTTENITKDAIIETRSLEELGDLVRFTTEIDPELVTACKDLGAHTQEAKAISMTSRNIARKAVGDETPEDRVRQRCMIATGDPSVADIMRFNNDPINAGVEAIKKGAPIFVDINMVKVGISKKGHNCDVICVLDEDADATIAHEYGITRTSAGFLACRDRLDGAIIAIGNAPSAALTACRLMEHGVLPALVVGTPVGFVNAARSKEEIGKMDVPSITCAGTRGGTPIAVACVNELIAMAGD
ncbi:MAG TPA: precorrin-8X methylmutase [Methanosarcinaceae archaeon]|nr:precorrin-8X methylmutase [Methanosarcinaceae archaeon]